VCVCVMVHVSLCHLKSNQKTKGYSALFPSVHVEQTLDTQVHPCPLKAQGSPLGINGTYAVQVRVVIQGPNMY